VLFDVRTLPIGDWTVVSVVGDLDVATMPTLRQHLDRVEEERVALDLGGVDYVDPVTLGILVVGALRASRRGGRFVVVCGPGAARDLLAETGLDRILDVVDDRTRLD
jgi:anti-anti-sigma factor